MPLYPFSILVAPKWVLKRIKNLQQNFLWGSSGQNCKWTLVKWATVCLPKNTRGIGLQDPQHCNAVMGARIWWKWLSSPHTPWAILWTTKYADKIMQDDLIQLTNMEKGSLIWNAARHHRAMT